MQSGNLAGYAPSTSYTAASLGSTETVESRVAALSLDTSPPTCASTPVTAPALMNAVPLGAAIVPASVAASVLPAAAVFTPAMQQQYAQQQQQQQAAAVMAAAVAAQQQQQQQQQHHHPQPPQQTSANEEGIAPFVIKTYELVNDPNTQHLVGWSREHDRRAFVVCACFNRVSLRLLWVDCLSLFLHTRNRRPCRVCVNGIATVLQAQQLL